MTSHFKEEASIHIEKGFLWFKGEGEDWFKRMPLCFLSRHKDRKQRNGGRRQKDYG